METKTQLRVVKADGSLECYMHTKVIGTINNALGGIGESDVFISENLAEAVTYYLYNNKIRNRVTSCEIFSIIQAALSSTGYERAVEYVQQYHFERRLKRNRIEVVGMDVKHLDDAEKLLAGEHKKNTSRWDKSIIAKDLIENHKVDKQMARAVASMVEERVFSLGLNLVPVSLIKQLVWNDAAKILEADKQLSLV